MSTNSRLATFDRGVLAVAWVVALVATAGSLNYSLGLGLFPCRLCWYQRILMYPLVVVLGVMVFSKRLDPPPWRFVLPLSVPGAAIAAYHSWLQVTPSETCSFAGCASVQYRAFGILTIPNQSLIAFSLITLLVGGLFVRSLVGGGSNWSEAETERRERAARSSSDDPGQFEGDNASSGGNARERARDDGRQDGVTGSWDDSDEDDDDGEDPDRR